jgi:hypothetical protein
MTRSSSCGREQRLQPCDSAEVRQIFSTLIPSPQMRCHGFARQDPQASNTARRLGAHNRP